MVAIVRSGVGDADGADLAAVADDVERGLHESGVPTASTTEARRGRR